jgi:hypothetical protein
MLLLLLLSILSRNSSQFRCISFFTCCSRRVPEPVYGLLRPRKNKVTWKLDMKLVPWGEWQFLILRGVVERSF